MGKPFVVVASLILLALAAGAPAKAGPDAGEWSDARGTATAARLIEGCLKTGATAREANAACVNAAFEACTRENGGTMSQYDLNVCRRYSYEAWRQRYESILGRFDTLFQAWAQPAAEGWQRATATRFRSQEAAWRRWAAADCEMWELGSVGGTIHSYAVATCDERHIALRTVDLAPLLEWLETR
jgi:hypothetical protein